ncbi:MAG: hypothetical protein A3B99_01130 [Candidatus Yanofskybacteria bacterium RIFCSPHIGHO2_02_FULL_44_12b]|uniref:Uncharacterized protein n=1 Tax=Candidatus Yanofskybacteria bacterium RIFCSPLOWO2_01_FULL_44_22 TaxID=1802697 RepID=A0A1F8GLW6_9BACT|nr:MAG: hypothetical protein A2659_03795 [Candidatus Yanofskybacteria bacterium RIFCSPHIGHO2_01_FULL_44_24]OGN15435.1 MAG: hypothetical protein A3B99_01130 [Candidatus Yanofskybacteria bacterium RIFCSPHIGHO2_02_FULL_44_12b]OGN25419.1 MAG: hypothetical protein A2925_00095 [Candidatus Yanofskybacteria bacterium RIFCSPLOWO2_01_FULL_44_22]
MLKYLKNKKILSSVILLTIVLGFLPISNAHAQVELLVGGISFLTSALTSGGVFPSLASWITQFLVEFVVGYLGKLLEATAKIFNWVIYLSAYPSSGHLTVVQESWRIIRDFTNMFFIVILVIMAFATIFDISKYDYRNILPKFLIAAVLINFSLVIGGMIINFSQVLSSTFLTSIGDAAAQLGHNLVKGVPTIQFGNTAVTVGQTTQAVVGQGAIIAISTIVLMVMMLISMGTAIIFALIRIPVLWFLLIMSPIAWLTGILPSTQHINQKWWKNFWAWTFFLPIYLFFLYFGIYFLNESGNTLGQLNANFSAGEITSIGLTFQTIFNFVLVGIFLIGGAAMAMSMSMFSGTSVVRAASWSRKAAGGILTLGQGGVISRAAKERREQFQKEGFKGTPVDRWTGGIAGKIYGGKEGSESRADIFRKAFGVTGIDDKRIAAEVESARRRILAENPDRNEEALRRKMNTSNSKGERIAAAELLREFHQELKAPEIKKIYEDYGGDKSVLANKFLAGINYNSLGRSDREYLEGDPKDPTTGIQNKQMRERLRQVQFNNGEFGSLDEATKALTMFTNEGTRVTNIGKLKNLMEDSGKQERLAFYDKLEAQGASKAELRATAEFLVKKGDFDSARIEKMAGTSISPDGKPTNSIYESKAELERFLNSAQESDPKTAINVKRRFKMLRDENGELIKEPITDDDVKKAIRADIENRTTSQIWKISETEDENVKEAMVEELTPDRIKSMMDSPEFKGKRAEKFKGIFKAVYGKYLTEVEKKFNDSADELEKAIKNGNKEDQRKFTTEARNHLRSMTALKKKIDDNKKAEASTKESAQAIFSASDVRLNRLLEGELDEVDESTKPDEDESDGGPDDGSGGGDGGGGSEPTPKPRPPKDRPLSGGAQRGSRTLPPGFGGQSSSTWRPTPRPPAPPASPSAPPSPNRPPPPAGPSPAQPPRPAGPNPPPRPTPPPNNPPAPSNEAPERSTSARPSIILSPRDQFVSDLSEEKRARRGYSASPRAQTPPPAKSPAPIPASPQPPKPERPPESAKKPRDYGQILKDVASSPAYKKIMEAKSLEYLKTKAKEYFEREFSGELDKDGYLMKKDGTSSNTKPSQNIGGGKALQWVLDAAQDELSSKYPEEAKKYGY